VARGGEVTCALDRERAIWCWGGNNFGQLGHGTINFDSATPQQTLPVDGEVVALRAGGTHVCARTAERDAWCWGNNGWGELGLGYASRDEPAVPEPHVVEALRGRIELLAAAEVQTCAADATTTWCWGGRDNAEAGAVTPTQVDWGGVPDQLSMGRTQTCAIQAGRVSCWPANYQVHPDVSEIHDIALPEHVQRLALGDRHGCAIGESGRLYCWGDNDLGQLGRVTADDSMNPAEEVTLHAGPFSRIAIGDDFTCAIDGRAELWCWGDNTFGQIQYVAISNRHFLAEPSKVEIPCP
jgi:alpha-tubulin suppressor-like RCC1 family protein